MSRSFPIRHRRGESIGSDGPTVRDRDDGRSPPMEVRHDASPAFGKCSQAPGARGARQPLPAVSVEEQPREPADKQQQHRVGLPHGDGDLVGGMFSSSESAWVKRMSSVSSVGSKLPSTAVR